MIMEQKHLVIKPKEFLMIGNSLKSDILPVASIGANAIHIPFHTTWIHEEAPVDIIETKNYYTVDAIKDVLKILN